MDETDVGCDLKISDFQGFFDLAYQILGSAEFSWDDFLDALLTFPGLTDEVKDELRTSIAFIQDDPFLLELSQETVNEYLDTYGDISLCELAERENGGSETPSTTPQNIVGNAAAEIFLAGLGDDTVDGGAGNDLINGGAGNDLLFGGLGSDVILGGLGNDQLYADTLDQLAEAGSNILNLLWAGLGADSLFGSSARDFLGGGAGDDVIAAGAGDDILYGGNATDTEAGGDDSLAADDGDDIVYAADGNDTVDGGAGNDTLFGGAGDDNITGAAGNDVIWGGAGDDTLSGGEGADSFLFIAASGVDVISDYDVSDDSLDLSATSFDFTSVDDVQARTTETATGLIIDLGSDATLTLDGISISDFADMSFIL